jgi:hypothetical protein
MSHHFCKLRARNQDAACFKLCNMNELADGSCRAPSSLIVLHSPMLTPDLNGEPLPRRIRTVRRGPPGLHAFSSR